MMYEFTNDYHKTKYRVSADKGKLSAETVERLKRRL